MGIWSDYAANYTKAFPKEFFLKLSDNAAEVYDKGSIRSNWVNFGVRSVVAAPICAVCCVRASIYAGTRFGASVAYNTPSWMGYATLGTLPLAFGIISGVAATSTGLAFGGASAATLAAGVGVSAAAVAAISIVKAPSDIYSLCSKSNKKVQDISSLLVEAISDTKSATKNVNSSTKKVQDITTPPVIKTISATSGAIDNKHRYIDRATRGSGLSR